MVPPLAWQKTLICLLPLWLLSISVMAEGFPHPPIPIGLAYASFALAVLVSVLLVWKGWMTFGLILYSLVPFVYLMIFDEISTTYKTPFIVLCSLLLSAGLIGVQRGRPSWTSWLILLSVAVVTLVMASNAANNFMEMSAYLGYQECFPDAYDCAPLAGRGSPWWILFF
jgi:hypothetical protein